MVATDPRTDPPPTRRGRRAARRARDAALGSRRGLGLWILPFLLLTAAIGAALAGGLAVLYYAQQVSALESSTSESRAQIDEAAEAAELAAAEAEEAITEQVRQVREQLTQGLPVESVADAGVLPVAASHERNEIRTGSAFTVFSTSDETFLATTYDLVATADDFAVETVDVLLDTGVISAEVINFDADLDLSVLRLDVGPLPVLDWRPASEPITRGDQIVQVGVAGADAAVLAEGRVIAVSADGLLTTLPEVPSVAGGPLLDSSGRVVAIATVTYGPDPSLAGRMAVPVAALCEGLLRCTQEDLGGEGQPGIGTTRPVPAERIGGFTPRPPDPEPDPEPESEPDADDEDVPDEAEDGTDDEPDADADEDDEGDEDDAPGADATDGSADEGDE